MPDHGGGDLSIEKRFRNLPGVDGEQIEILPPGVDDLLNLGITDEFPEDIERSSGLYSRKVDNSGGGRGGDLDQLEPWDKGVFPDKFRVQRQSWTLPQCSAEGFERMLVCHIRRRWIGYHVCLILWGGRWRPVIEEVRHC